MEHEERLRAALADRYRIEREIGRGGMATVFLAHDLKHHRQVAIKVLRPELAATLGPDRFIREIEIAAKLSHPHILPLHDSGGAGGILYYVMPFVEGESLRERLDREGKLSVAETVRLTDEIASALSYAHEQGVVHRDVKPENIMLSGGRAVMADFGIGRAVTAAAGDRLTGTGFAVGTPAYMSPEQAYGDESVDGRTDVYALGCVVYEMVSGRAPFEADTPQAVLAKQAAGTVPSLRASDPAIPLFVERAVERALAKSPDERFQTATEFAEALTSEMVVARVGKRRWTRLAAAGATIVLVAAAALVLLNVLGGSTYELLAVLPPTNLMNDPEQEGFIDGMHSALISELQVAGIPVIARTSVMQFRDGETPIREIANELGAGAVVETQILRAGDSVEIEVSLVDGTTQQYVGDPIVRRSDLRNVLTMYRDLSRAIASEIQFALTPQAEAHLASASPVNPQAYDAYVRGVSQWHATHIDRALEYFQQALSLDPTYAPAQAGVARVLWWQAGDRQMPARAQARAAIDQALALDSTLAEVQYVAALVWTWLDWDWEEGEAAFRKAIEINPNYAEARAFYAGFLSTMERPEEARAQMERALELDPLSPMIMALDGQLLVRERRYAEAIAEFWAVLRIEPNHTLALFGLVKAYHESGDYDEALAASRRANSGDQEALDALDRGYAEGGYRTAILRLAETVAARPAAQQSIVGVAWTYAGAGDRERTLEWLELAYEVRDFQLPGALAASGFGPVPGDDPRYQALRRRMNLPIGPEGN